jgi:hypothetical protein
MPFVRGLHVLMVAALMLLFVVSRPAAQGSGGKFSGYAINMNGGAQTAVVDFVIDRWSTAAERKRLLDIVHNAPNSTDALLGALKAMPVVGYIKGGNTLRWDLRYAWQNPLEDGGRQIVLATDRPITFREQANKPQSVNYPFTILEMRLNRDDKGQGKIHAGARLFVDDNGNIAVENYAREPLRFNEIKKSK